jgi:hypothetical protein
MKEEFPALAPIPSPPEPPPEMRRSQRRHGHFPNPATFSSSFARWGIVVLALLSLVLGGSTELWEQSTVVLLGGVLIFLFPPRRSPGMVPFLLASALFLLALTAFLPAGWSSLPHWRQHLLEHAQVVLPLTRTPRPWLTAQACSFLFVSLVWGTFILSQAWDRESRFRTAQVLVLGVALLAGMMTAAYCFDFHVPNWDQEENRGWFPNRNQTADVLAVCGVINYVLLFDSMRRRRLAAFLWIISLVLIGAALVVSYSRAGIVMFFGGILLWHIWPVKTHRRKMHSTKWAVLGLAMIFVLLTGFFLMGGDTLARFETPGQTLNPDDFRVAIQKDALRFSTRRPFLGVGLGNFESLFASTQRDSINADRAIHPESDWLWAACEMGWFAPLIFLAAIAWWLRRCVPFRSKPGESLRRATLVGGILFLLHGLVDVSGHRLGSAWIGLLLVGLALPRSATVTTAARASGRLQIWGFRVLALGMLLVAGWWIASLQGAAAPPTTADLARIESNLDRALAAHQLQKVRDLASAGLRIAPVNWHLYFQRGYAEAFLPGNLAQAGDDFRIARQLEGRWVRPCYDEGDVWLEAGEPDLCLDAWQEALRRAGPLEAYSWYNDMLSLARGNDRVHAGLMEMAAGDFSLQRVFLGYAAPDEMKKVLGDMLAADPGLLRLNNTQRGQIFALWWERGDQAQFLSLLALYPQWIEAGWPYVAEADAAQKNFQQAWKTVARYATVPVEPAPSTVVPDVDLERAFRDRDDNAAAGVMLYLSQEQQGKTDEALGTIRALEKLKDCPKYVYFDEAELWASKQQWELAWAAWENYRGK